MRLINILAISTFFSFPLYLIRFSFFGLPFNLLDFLAILTIVFWFLKNGFNYDFKSCKKVKFFCFAILLMFIGILFSFLLNSQTLAGLSIIKSWFILPFIFSWVIFNIIKKENFLKEFMLTLFCSTTLIAIVSITYKLYGKVTYDNRLAGFYSSPNYLAMFLAPGFFVGLQLLFEKYQTKKIDSLSFVLLVAATTLILMDIYFTFSYATWFSIFLAILFMFMFIQKNHTKKIISVFAIFLFIFSIFFLTQLQTKKLQGILQKDPRSSFASRQMIWQSSFKIIQNNFFTGIGPGNFQKEYLAYQKYFPPYLEWAVPQPHNVYLAFWLQAGLLGIIGFIMLIFKALKNSFLQFMHKENALLAPFGFFIYFIIYGFFDTPYWKNDLAYLFWFFIFISFIGIKSKQKI